MPLAQRNGSGQYDIYGMPADGGQEKQLTSNPHQDDGPDYSPDGKWIYINSDRSGKEAIWRFPADGAGSHDAKAEMVVNDGLEDWFPHISPDGKKMVYIGYPAGTPSHNPRTVHIEIKLVAIDHGKGTASQKTLVEGIGGQGTLNVNSWAPDPTQLLVRHLRGSAVVSAYHPATPERSTSGQGRKLSSSLESLINSC